jgi:hypothetical protein
MHYDRMDTVLVLDMVPVAVATHEDEHSNQSTNDCTVRSNVGIDIIMAPMCKLACVCLYAQHLFVRTVCVCLSEQYVCRPCKL